MIANHSSFVFFLLPGRSAGGKLAQCLLWAAVVCWAGHINDAQAAKRDGQHSSAVASSAKTPTVRLRTQRSSSEESRKEREQRLRRECRGRPDAGACLGYTKRY